MKFIWSKSVKRIKPHLPHIHVERDNPNRDGPANQSLGPPSPFVGSIHLFFFLHPTHGARVLA